VRVLGIDPGVNGALALLVDGALVWVVDMPTLEDGPKGRRTVSAFLLAQIVAESHASLAYIEKVGTMPGEGAVGAFSFGRSVGVIHGVCCALCVGYASITPQSWKKYHGLSKEAKDASRSKAISLWPSFAEYFSLKKHDGRAEAALIALAGWKQ
jgi:crossover junction endodeoxyribonuclease RuvC